MTIQIIVNNRVINQYKHEGDTYIEGRPGSEYIIRYTNDSYNKRKVVISVDGLNVITGDTNFEGGYVVDGYSSIDIEGWRKDNSTIAKFKFGSKKNSYNAKNEHGIETSIGVIGVKEYDQEIKINYTPSIRINDYYPNRRINPSIPWDNPWTSPPIWYSVNNTNNVEITASSTVNNIGTEWGNYKESKVEVVSDKFKKELACPPKIIYYDDVKGLEARGIQVKDKKVFVKPNPFPQTKFCEPPK